MNRQAMLDFSEGFLTVMFAGGAVGGAAFGSTFPGWWVMTTALVPTLGMATLAGIRRVQAGRREPNGAAK